MSVTVRKYQGGDDWEVDVLVCFQTEPVTENVERFGHHLRQQQNAGASHASASFCSKGFRNGKRRWRHSESSRLGSSTDTRGPIDTSQAE